MHGQAPLADAFERFWEAYGYKLGKKAALAAWRRQGCEKISETVIAAIAAYDRYLAANPWLNKKHAATFLNGWHWEDEYPATQSQPEKKRTLSDAARDFGRHNGDAERLGHSARH